MLLFLAITASVLGAGYAAYALTRNIFISIGIGLVALFIFICMLQASR